MKIEPIYLLAPEAKPKVRSMTSRRAFLLAGSMFAAGTLVGGACGYTLGAAKTEDSAGAAPGVVPEPKKKKPDEVVLEPSGDATLDELRRLAVKAPIEELVAQSSLFLGLRSRDYRDDQTLWQGLNRLANEVIDNPNHRLSRSTVVVLRNQIEGQDWPPELNLKNKLRALRTRLEAMKR